MAKNEKAKSDPVREASNLDLPKELYLCQNQGDGDPWDWYEKHDADEGTFVVYAPVRVVSVEVKSVRKETVI